MAARLLTAFRFEISLIRSTDVVAGSPWKLASKAGAPAEGKDPLGNCDGAFQECSGLEIEMDVQEYVEGGRNNGVIRRAGRAKYQPLILKRGMFFAGEAGDGTDSSGDNNADSRLWEWMQGVINGERPIARYDGLVYVKSSDDKVRATWVFERGLPAKVKGPELNGKTGEIAIEELHIAHEGLFLLPSSGARG